MPWAIKASSPDAAEGIVRIAYLKDPTDKVEWGNDPGVKLHYDIMANYCAGCDPNDGTYFAGMSAAWTLGKVLDKAGRNGVTRDNRMHARSMSFTDSPFLLPGIRVQPSGDSSRLHRRRCRAGRTAPLPRVRSWTRTSFPHGELRGGAIGSPQDPTGHPSQAGPGLLTVSGSAK